LPTVSTTQKFAISGFVAKESITLRKEIKKSGFVAKGSITLGKERK
jgi:hypothetical protein